jgi:uncharacterized protein YceK
MRRKHNPFVALLALFLLALIVTWICNGCSVESDIEETDPTTRFTVEYAGNQLRIVTDTETGVQYLAYCIYQTGVCITRLEAE